MNMPDEIKEQLKDCGTCGNDQSDDSPICQECVKGLGSGGVYPNWKPKDAVKKVAKAPTAFRDVVKKWEEKKERDLAAEVAAEAGGKAVLKIPAKKVHCLVCKGDFGRLGWPKHRQMEMRLYGGDIFDKQKALKEGKEWVGDPKAPILEKFHAEQQSNEPVPPTPAQ